MKSLTAAFLLVAIVAVHGRNLEPRTEELSDYDESNLWVVDEDGNLVHLDLDAEDDEDIEETRKDLVNRVKFYLHTQENPKRKQAQQLWVGNTTILNESYFDPAKPTRIVTHGWMNSAKSDACGLIRKAYLEHDDYNVIVVDWSKISHKPYVVANNRVKIVGEYVGNMIDFLVKRGMNPADLLLVGHSLGAHVVGLGALLSSHTVGYVVGLDPALPLFYFAKPEDRIDKGHASYVQIIHTNAGGLGYSSAIGHVDFYPNGGSTQAGCLLDASGACSHARSYQFFAESINSKRGFVGTQCDSYKKYRKGKCKGNDQVIMGGPTPTTTATESYYLDTKIFSPYAKKS